VLPSIALAALLRQFGFTFYTGVPDSVLRGFCAALDLRGDVRHVPAANEGAAVGLAVGWYLASGDVPAIYLQNSGLWNALNPYFSLAHRTVYDIPLLFIVGWRGRPGFNDEPQHSGSGAETERALHMMGITPLVLDKWDDDMEARATDYLKRNQVNGWSSAFLVPSGVFDRHIPAANLSELDGVPSRGEVVDAVLHYVHPEDFVVAGIGHTGRELYSARLKGAERSGLLRDFLCVGGMGYALQVAIGAALRRSTRQVWCIEGDGSFLMHLGTAALVGALDELSVIYVLLDNGAHASVGGQKTACKLLDYGAAACTLGFRSVESPRSIVELQAALGRLLLQPGPRFLWTRIRNEPGMNLPRPGEPLADRKRAVMDFLAHSKLRIGPAG
jgi:phosphonopyruvate decarboxylase